MKVYNVISADSHIECPPDQWSSRLPEEMSDHAPRVVSQPSGGDGVQIGKVPPAPLGLQVTGGQRWLDFRLSGRSFADGLAGTGGPEQRIQEQDTDGTDAEVLFSSVAVSALRRTEDPDVSCAIARAYNDWLSEYCSFAPDRLFGMALIPPTNAVDASKEARRIAGFPGIRGLQLLAFPDGEATATLGDEPFWEEVDELGIAVVAHHNWGGEERGKSHVLPGQKEKILKVGGDVDLSYFAYLLSGDMPIPTIPIITIEELFLAGVLDRHPTLRFHFAETGIGWLPYWLEQMDDRYERHRHWAGVELARRPSEYVRDQFTFSFQEDHAGIAARHAIGVDNICWASDFPHAVGDWPYSRETRERQLKDVPDDERRKIEGLNIAAQLRVITAEQKHDESLLPRDEVPPSPLLERGERQLTRTSST